MKLFSVKEHEIVQKIFNKEKNDYEMTKEQYNFIKDFDLSDKNLPFIANKIWKYRNNAKVLKLLLKILQDNEIHDYDNVIDNIQRVGVV